jgi:dinuclear metal center YbgI/SA1388 family protein
MPTVANVCQFLEELAPPQFAEEWDNVGLLVGNPLREIRSVMTCLTVTPVSASEAVEEGANLVVSHHPLPFRPLKRLTTETTTGRLLLQLIENEIAVYSAHTAFDSASAGINQWLSEIVGISDPQPLIQKDDQLCAGRYGDLFQPMALDELALRLKLALGQERIQIVGDRQRIVHRVAVGGGSAGQFLEHAQAERCDLFITGETNFHTCLEAEASDIAMILVGHFASERFAMDRLAELLKEQFAELNVWASRKEADPIRWV